MTQQHTGTQFYAPVVFDPKARPPGLQSGLRNRVCKKGKLIHPNNKTLFDCMVREIHEDGARLSCGDAVMLPNELRLAIPSFNEVRRVRVVWRRPREVWVRFLEPPQPLLNLII